jgi:putative (di)nucleoside polyphosphate hydrolase
MDITCGLYLYNKATKKFLLGHATRSRSSWSIPKGLKDKGEDELQAAIRETEEETGLKISELDVENIYRLPPVVYKKQKKILASFLVMINTDLSDRKLVCHSLVNGTFPEIDRFIWADAAQVREMAHEAQVRNMDRIEQLLKETDS